MKTYKTIISIFALLNILSCSSNEIVNPLAGTWKFAYEEYTNCTDPIDNGHYDYQCNQTDCFKFLFSKSNQYEYQVLSVGNLSVQQGTYSVENGKLILCTTFCDNPIDFKFESGLLLLISHDDQGCTITKGLEKL